MLRQEKHYSNGGPRQCDGPARRMVDCGRNYVLKENKMYIEHKPGRGRVEEEMPRVGGSHHIPKRDACAKMKINQSINHPLYSQYPGVSGMYGRRKVPGRRRGKIKKG